MFLLEFGRIAPKSSGAGSLSLQFKNCIDSRRPYADKKKLCISSADFSFWLKSKKIPLPSDPQVLWHLMVRCAVDCEISSRNADSLKCRKSNPTCCEHTLDREVRWLEAGIPFGTIQQVKTDVCLEYFVGEGCFFAVFEKEEDIAMFIAADRDGRIAKLGLSSGHPLLRE